MIDPATFEQLQANVGTAFVAELVDTFGEEAPLLLAELRFAQAAADGERFRRAAHALKSNGNAFGALDFAAQARALELGGMPSDTAPVEALAQEFERTLAALRERAHG